MQSRLRAKASQDSKGYVDHLFEDRWELCIDSESAYLLCDLLQKQTNYSNEIAVDAKLNEIGRLQIFGDASNLNNM